MLTVKADAGRVERRLANGDLSCPLCDGRLGPWGWSTPRILRGLGGATEPVTPRRARCSACLVTHVLLPVVALLRRADLAEVIGRALVAKTAGTGVRAIAAELDRHPDTVRGWLRRFAARAEHVRSWFTELLVDVAPYPLLRSR